MNMPVHITTPSSIASLAPALACCGRGALASDRAVAGANARTLSHRQIMSNRGGRRRQNGGMAVDQPTRPAEQIKVPFVEIRNWEGGPFADLVSFVERRAKIALQQPKQVGNVVSAQITASETRDAEKLSGVRFSGNRLSIKVVYKPVTPSPETSQTIQILRDFLNQRYVPAAGLLDLSAMMGDATLQAHGFLANAATALKTFQALMKIAKSALPRVVSVKLDANGLADGELVAHVASTYPGLLNLSLANNMLASVQSLAALRNKLPALRELVLAGNPVQQHPAYESQVREVVQMFPKLLIIDGLQVRDEAQLPGNALPLPLKPTFFEDDGVAQVVPHFLTNFFMLWDTNRPGLLPLYDDASLFSMCYNAAAPHLPSSKPAPQSYISNSRNLERNSSQHARHNKVHVGAARIHEAFAALPASRHDLANAAAFAIDAWKVSDVRAFGDTAIIISVHGEFVETAKNEPRSFDRCLVVLPGPSSYLVASDMLTVRMHAQLPVATAGAAPTPAPAQMPAAAAPVPVQAGQVPGQVPGQAPGMAPGVAPGVAAGMAPGMAPGQAPGQAADLVQEVMRQTRLTQGYAEMCLQQANFDLAAALQLFQQYRAQLPPDAFQAM